jgi:hypothetical protein
VERNVAEVGVDGTTMNAVDDELRTSHLRLSHGGASFPTSMTDGNVAEGTHVRPPSLDSSRVSVQGPGIALEHGVCNIQIERPIGTTAKVAPDGLWSVQDTPPSWLT